MYKQLQTVINRYKRLKTSGNPEDQLALEYLIKNVSFRLPASASHDNLIGVKTLVKAIIEVWKTKAQSEILNDSSDSAIIELTDRHRDMELESILKHTGEKIGLFLNKLNLCIPQSTGVRLRIMSRIFRFGLGNALRCLVSSDRANLAMLPVYFLEMASLLSELETQKIKFIYHFAPYDLDSNLFYFICNEAGMKMAKLPSPGPLRMHNHILFADELMLSCEYQFNELKTLPNVRATTINKWLPESAFKYIDRYVENAPVPPPRSLGYYSHASWVRHAEGHVDTGVKVEEAEELVLSFLAKYYSNQDQGKVIIFLHPREKEEDVIDRARAYYAEKLPDVNFEFSTPGVSSADGFGTVDVGLAAFSTVLYERLFCGYKTLICNHGTEGFPLPDTSLSSVCFDNFDVMQKLLKEAQVKSQDQFFESHKLKGYRYYEYPYFSDRK